MPHRVTVAWWKDHGFADQIASSGTAEVGKRVGIILIKQRSKEAKQAGIVVLSELVGEHLHTLDLGALGTLLRDGHLCDAKLVGAFSFRVLYRVLQREEIRAGAIHELAQWRHAEEAWQRYAMCMAFLGLVPRAKKIEGLTETILAICASIVWSVDKLDQSAVGTILRSLSHFESKRVEAFFLRYARFMSKSCARRAVFAYPPAKRDELLAHHKRATTL